MRAVNLIPADDTGGRRASGSGFGAYAVLGVLALLIAMSAIYTLSGRAVHEREAQLAAVTAQVEDTEAKAASLKDFAAFSTMRQARVETVRNLVDSRFDWADALHEVARTIPTGAWITSLRATVNPAVGVDGTGDALRGALAVPAIELSGCAKSQSGVAGTVISLRGMSGVQRVSLSKSQKSGGAAASSSGDSAGANADAGGCGARPQFSLTVFYNAPAAPAAGSTTASTGATTP
jgi:Tfp pilus assembly protein PilN